MIAGILLDYHFSGWWPSTIMRLAPTVEVRFVGGPNAPAFNAQDPAILLWLESNRFILVTNNRRSMPLHLANQWHKVATFQEFSLHSKNIQFANSPNN